MRRRRHALPDAHTAGGAFLGGKPLSPLWRLGKSGDAAVCGGAPGPETDGPYTVLWEGPAAGRRAWARYISRNEA